MPKYGKLHIEVPDDLPKEAIQLVLAIRDLNFKLRDISPTWVREIYQLQYKFGSFEAAIGEYAHRWTKGYTKGPRDWAQIDQITIRSLDNGKLASGPITRWNHVLSSAAHLALGHHISGLIKLNRFENVVPAVFPMFDHARADWVVRISCLQWIPDLDAWELPWCRLVKGQRLAVRGHVIHRLATRVWPHCASMYAEGEDAHMALLKGEFVHTEPLVLPTGQQGLALWKRAERIMRSEYEVAKTITGKNLTASHVWLRLGYIPLSVHDSKLRGETFLLPGFRGTPEERLLPKVPANLREVSKQLRDGGEIAARLKSFDQDALALIKVFHDAGVPQVRERFK